VFVVLVNLGGGGLGTVRKAWDTKLQRSVALKIPHVNLLASAEFSERLLREARAAAGPPDRPGEHDHRQRLQSGWQLGRDLRR
jgi:serine/threonine protein kinase